MNQKTCTKCSLSLSVNHFRPLKKGCEKLRSICKNCDKEYMSLYQKKRWSSDASFRERVKRQASDWSKNNPEKRSAIAKKRNQKELALFPEKVSARALVNQRVRFKRLPRAKDLLCSCGEQAAHYHHYKGYAFEHRYDVIPVCTKCHAKLG